MLNAHHSVDLVVIVPKYQKHWLLVNPALDIGLHCKKWLAVLHVPSRDVTNQTLTGRE
jgi:hypothetical protein